MLKKIVYILFAICILIANIYVPAEVFAEEEKTFGQIKQELADFKQKYEENKLQQNYTKEEKEKIKDNIRQIERDISNTQQEIYELKQEIEKLNEDIIKKENEIKDILAFYQISNGEAAYLEYAFGAKTFTDFIYRTAVSEQLTAYNNSLVEQYKDDIEESKKKTEQLNIKVKELEKKQVNLKEELVKVSNELEDLADDAVSIEAQIKLVEEQIELFTDMGCKDSETMDECARSKIPSDKGFSRPLDQGYISSYPGYRCVLGSCSTHHGLDMSASGANHIDYPVYPIARGVVLAVYTAHVNGGRKIYIQHNIDGKLYVSAYWHLRQVNVKKGDIVTKATQIAIMGGTESWDEWTTGAHLHLELSTSNFNENSIYSIRANWLHPEYYINFPNKGVTWYNRVKQY